MYMKKEPAKADPSQTNYITDKAKRLSRFSGLVHDLIDEHHIEDVRVRDFELEFLIDNLTTFYKESEGCHVRLERNNNDKLPYVASFYVYSIKFAIELNDSDLQEFRKLFKPEEYTDRLTRDVYSMTVKELVDSGAQINIFYHENEGETKARNNIEQFEQIADIKQKEMTGDKWFTTFDGNVDIVSFYKEEEE